MKQNSKNKHTDMLKIGVIGYSAKEFDTVQAEKFLRGILSELARQNPSRQIEIVSGYTNCGIPKIAYEIAAKLGYNTVGYSAKEALQYNVYDCKKVIIVGEKFGDESKSFVTYCDILIRVGGGDQSMREIAMFKETGKSVYELDLPVLA